MLKSERRNCSKQELKDKNMLIKSLHIKGMLSFQDMSIDMRPLNVLIGPNASGKSNLIEIIALLQALPRDLAGFVRESGGIDDWLWKGKKSQNKLTQEGSIEVVLDSPPYFVAATPLRYTLAINNFLQQTNVLLEVLENVRTHPGQDKPYQYFRMLAGGGSLSLSGREGEVARDIAAGTLTPGQSIFHEIRDPISHQEMFWVRLELEKFHFYREWKMGKNSAARKPQRTDFPTNSLAEDFSNLALVLNEIQRQASFQEIEENLQQFYDLYEQVGIGIQANTAQLWIREKGLNNVVPATRLSEGTLKFLALLVILCHPTPPPFICIEEPDLGLHPDLIPQIARLLKSASERTQLIITTHSKALIDEFSDDPESVVVCERNFDAGTEFKRLSADKLEKWLERYELGELWEKGEIGGTRW